MFRLLHACRSCQFNDIKLVDCGLRFGPLQPRGQDQHSHPTGMCTHAKPCRSPPAHKGGTMRRCLAHSCICIICTSKGIMHPYRSPQCLVAAKLSHPYTQPCHGHGFWHGSLSTHRHVRVTRVYEESPACRDLRVCSRRRGASRLRSATAPTCRRCPARRCPRARRSPRWS